MIMRVTARAEAHGGYDLGGGEADMTMIRTMIRKEGKGEGGYICGVQVISKAFNSTVSSRY